MAFKGNPRDHGAGRKKGTVNKATQSLLDILKEEGVDPFRGFCELSRSEDPNIKMKALSELCQYVYPKRKAIEHSFEPTDDELKEIIKERLDGQ
jgi:hypothetical protein